jgi:putative ABC transport system permease protein
MKPSKSFKLALNILVHSKVRSWLTIIGIVIGVAAVVAIMSISEGMQQSLESNLGGLGADIITISPGASRATGGFMSGGGGPPGASMTSSTRTSSSTSTQESKNLTKRDMQTIVSVDNVEIVTGTVSGRGELYYLAETVTVSVTGVNPVTWNEVTTSTLASGRFLTAGDFNTILVGSRVANSMFKQPLVVNRQVTIEGVNFKIVGILNESGSSMMGGGGSDSGIIMPIEAARSTLDDVGIDELDSIIVKVDDENLVDETMSSMDDALMLSRHVTNKTKDYSISSAVAMQETISATLESMTFFLTAIAAVSLLVGAVGIANTMFTTVLERTKQIGIMKAIGAKNRDIMTIFLMNSALVGLVGGAIGIAIGTAASMVVVLPMMGGRMAGGGNVVSPQLMLLSLAIAVGIGILAGLIPAYRASKLKPVDALRYE